jgi:hypothetical protein
MVAKNTVTSCGLHVLGYEPVMSPPLLHRRVDDVVVGYCSAVSKSRRTGEQSRPAWSSTGGQSGQRTAASGRRSPVIFFFWSMLN